MKPWRRLRRLATGSTQKWNSRGLTACRNQAVVSLDNIVTLPQSLFERRITTLSRHRMMQVWDALKFAFNMPH
jgi:hypothetical protein